MHAHLNNEKFINKTILTILTMEIDITKMTSKGQVVIPQDIRDKIGVHEGERFFVYANEDSIVLKRTKNLEAAKGIKKFDRVFNSMWKTAKKRGITQNDVENEMKAVRASKKQ